MVQNVGTKQRERAIELKLGTYKMTRETTAVNLKFLFLKKKKEKKQPNKIKVI